MSDDNDDAKSSLKDILLDEKYADLLNKFDISTHGREEISMPAICWVSLTKTLRLSQQISVDLLSFVLALDNDDSDEMQEAFDDINTKLDSVDESLKVIEMFVMKAAMKVDQDKGPDHD